MESVADCLAANIKRYREELQMTQTQLADRAGISLIFLQSIESKRKWISPKTIKQLATALEISESRLFENCFEKKSSSKPVKRLSHKRLDHIPTDVFNALATTCKNNSWKWDTIRWIIQGYERNSGFLRK